jgi:hypothetical protein
MEFKQNSARLSSALIAMAFTATCGGLAFAKSADKPSDGVSAPASSERNKSSVMRPTEGTAERNKSGTIPIDLSVAPTTERNIHQYPGGGHAITSAEVAPPEATKQPKPKPKE